MLTRSILHGLRCTRHLVNHRVLRTFSDKLEGQKSDRENKVPKRKRRMDKWIYWQLPGTNKQQAWRSREGISFGLVIMTYNAAVCAATQRHDAALSVPAERWSVDFAAATKVEAEAEAEAEAEEWPRHVVSGVQPTGTLHVGNYFGAVRRCARLQQRGEDLTLFIADLHALTTTQEGSLRQRVLDTCALALASGVDPERGALFVQSAVPRHAELGWLLTCLATQARLAQLPQYRERAARHADGGVPLGALLYPVLQAADVLLYRGTHVPVGRDQLRHLQLAAHLARAFRTRHGAAAFPEPRALLPADGADRLLSLRDPSRKMSKSDPDPRSRILLSDGPEEIALKIRKAVTDTTPHVSYEPATRPGVSNLVALHCLAADKLPEEAVQEAEGLTTAQYKRVVAAALAEHLDPVRERHRALAARPAFLREVLRHGAVRARARADATWARVAALAGLR